MKWSTKLILLSGLSGLVCNDAKFLLGTQVAVAQFRAPTHSKPYIQPGRIRSKSAQITRPLSLDQKGNPRGQGRPASRNPHVAVPTPLTHTIHDRTPQLHLQSPSKQTSAERRAAESENYARHLESGP